MNNVIHIEVRFDNGQIPPYEDLDLDELDIDDPEDSGDDDDSPTSQDVIDLLGFDPDDLEDDEVSEGISEETHVFRPLDLSAQTFYADSQATAPVFYSDLNDKGEIGVFQVDAPQGHLRYMGVRQSWNDFKQGITDGKYKVITKDDVLKYFDTHNK